MQNNLTKKTHSPKRLQILEKDDDGYVGSTESPSNLMELPSNLVESSPVRVIKTQETKKTQREKTRQRSLLSLSTDGSYFNIQMHQRKLDQIRLDNIRAIEKRVASCNHNLKSLSSEHKRLLTDYYIKNTYIYKNMFADGMGQL